MYKFLIFWLHTKCKKPKTFLPEPNRTFHKLNLDTFCFLDGGSLDPARFTSSVAAILIQLNIALRLDVWPRSWILLPAKLDPVAPHLQ